MARAQENIHGLLLQLLQEHPDGLSVTEIRSRLNLTVEQQHLDRRIRTLRETYEIASGRRDGQHIYILKGRRQNPIVSAGVDGTTRARILHRDNSKCQMCGRTAAHDNIKLHIDHKVPRDWGGETEDDNLWALCSECNGGKKNFFASITDEGVRKAMLNDSIHVRIGEMLKFHQGKPVPKNLLALVTYTHDDWEKRMRELREIGWEYHSEKHKENGRVRVYFVLDKWAPWPKDVGAAIRAAEQAKKTRR